MGDVEPAEVIEQVTLAGRVVAHHPFGNGCDHHIEDSIDARTGMHRCTDSGNDRLAIVAHQCGQQRAIVLPAVVDRQHRRASRSSLPRARMNGRV